MGTLIQGALYELAAYLKRIICFSVWEKPIKEAASPLKTSCRVPIPRLMCEKNSYTIVIFVPFVRKKRKKKTCMLIRRGLPRDLKGEISFSEIPSSATWMANASIRKRSAFLNRPTNDLKPACYYNSKSCSLSSMTDHLSALIKLQKSL